MQSEREGVDWFDSAADEGRGALHAALVIVLLAALFVCAARAHRDTEAADPRAIERELRAPRPETRRAAVKKLADLAERPRLELLLQALEDSDPMVADEAQLALARISEEPLVHSLLGRAGLKSKDPWVRVRVAEAIGRMGGPLDGLALAKAIDGRDPEVACAVLWSLERRLAAAHALGERERIAREVEDLFQSRVDAEVRGRALVVLERCDHFRARPHIEAASRDRDPVLRGAALAAARGFPEAERLERARRALFDDEPSVRSCAIELLAELASKPALLELAHRMEIEPRERLRWRILAFLRARSGLAHGFDAAAWRAWAESVQGPWSTGPDRARRGPLGDTRVQLAGLNLISDRVALLVDFSGSTWDTKVGDLTRKDVLDRELRRALEALPATTKFNVIPYTNEPLPWSKQLVPATKENVARALAFFERSNARGRGNYFDAVLAALSDPEVDSIVALTDGVPTGGHRWNMPLMVDLLLERTRFRQVAFDAILVDAPRSRVQDWERLCDRTGGRCIEAELDPPPPAR